MFAHDTGKCSRNQILVLANGLPLPQQIRRISPGPRVRIGIVEDAGGLLDKLDHLGMNLALASAHAIHSTTSGSMRAFKNLDKSAGSRRSTWYSSPSLIAAQGSHFAGNTKSLSRRAVKSCNAGTCT